MAKQIKSRRAATSAGVEPRDILLAGLGAVSLTRKQGIKLYDTLLVEGRQFQGRFEQTIEGLQDQARIGAELVRERVEALVTPIRTRAEAVYGSARSEIETRLQPVLSRLGVKSGLKTRTRAAGTRVARKAKATTKRTVRKARAA